MNEQHDAILQQRWLVMHWGTRGGGVRFAIDMAKGLRDSGQSQVAISYNETSDLKDSWQALNVVEFPVRTYHTPMGVVLGLPRLLWTAIRLRRWIQRHGIDVVYEPMFSVWQSLAIWIYCPRSVKYVASIHDAEEHPGDEHWLKRICRRMDVSRADVVVTYSQDVETRLVDKGLVHRTRMARVPFGVSATDAATKARVVAAGEQFVLGFFGRILPYKGLDIFVEAVSELRRRGVAISAEVWGDGELPPGLTPSSVHGIEWHLGWLAEDLIDETLQRFDLLVLPYREASQSAVLGRAAGLGVPAVATPIGGLSEQVALSGAGVLSTQVSGSSIADAIEELSRNPGTYAALSSAGLASASGALSWRAVAEDMHTQVEEIIDASGRK